MKKLFLLLSLGFGLLGASVSNAQTFSFSRDTVFYTITGGTDNIYNNLNITASAAPLTLRWSVIGTNFPSDWLAATGICDNVLCYPNSSLWPSGDAQTTSPFAAGTGGFHMVFTGSLTTTGTHYYTVRMTNMSTMESHNATFALTAVGPTAVPTVANSIENVSLYPNPANNEVNIIFEKNADVKTIALYNNIGRIVAVYKTTGNSANLNLENLPSGIYFARLANTQGSLVATRKFTKQ